MPLDSSIFTNSAAMYQQGQQGLQNTISNAVQSYQQRKQQEAALAMEAQRMQQQREQQASLMQLERDKLEAQRNSPEYLAKQLEANGQLAVFKKLQGLPISPEEDAMANMFVRSQSKIALDPHGNMVVNNPYSDFLSGSKPRGLGSSALFGGGDNMPAPRSAPRTSVSSALLPPATPDTLPPVVPVDGTSAGEAADAAQAQMGAGRQLIDILTAPTANNAGIPMGNREQQSFATQIKNASEAAQIGSPNAQNKYREAIAEAPANIAKAYGTKKGESLAGSENKMEAANNILFSLDKVIKGLPSAPGGVLGNVVADVTNLANRPNQGAINRAKIEPEYRNILAKMKDFVRNPGEGTFTEVDQKVVADMTYNPYDSTAVKQEKVNTLKEIMNRWAESARQKQSADMFPGYKIERMQ